MAMKATMKHKTLLAAKRAAGRIRRAQPDPYRSRVHIYECLDGSGYVTAFSFTEMDTLRRLFGEVRLVSEMLQNGFQDYYGTK